jgi:hypothetical protein
MAAADADADAAAAAAAAASMANTALLVIDMQVNEPLPFHHEDSGLFHSRGSKNMWTLHACTHILYTFCSV